MAAYNQSHLNEAVPINSGLEGIAANSHSLDLEGVHVISPDLMAYEPIEAPNNTDRPTSEHPFLHKARRVVAGLTVGTSAIFSASALALPASTSSNKMRSVTPYKVIHRVPGYRFKIMGQPRVASQEQGTQVEYELLERNNTSHIARKVVADVYWGNKEKQYKGTLEPNTTKKHDFLVNIPVDPNKNPSPNDHFSMFLFVVQLVPYNGRSARYLYRAQYNIGYLPPKQ